MNNDDRIAAYRNLEQLGLQERYLENLIDELGLPALIIDFLVEVKGGDTTESMQALYKIACASPEIREKALMDTLRGH